MTVDEFFEKVQNPEPGESYYYFGTLDWTGCACVYYLDLARVGFLNDVVCLFHVSNRTVSVLTSFSEFARFSCYNARLLFKVERYTSKLDC